MADEDTWRPIQLVGGDGVTDAAGRVELATGTEQHPCMMCRSYEHDKKRLVDHLLANGLKPEPDGTFTTPIVGDFKGRNSLRINPDQYGYCRRFTMPVDMLATCPDWVQVRTSSEMASRIR